jgi:hypothetical protein
MGQSLNVRRALSRQVDATAYRGLLQMPVLDITSNQRRCSRVKPVGYIYRLHRLHIYIYIYICLFCFVLLQILEPLSLSDVFTVEVNDIE